jgi:hypothetical protein
MKIMTEATLQKLRLDCRELGKKDGRYQVCEFILFVRSRLPKTSTEKLNLLRDILIELDPAYGELNEMKARGKRGSREEVTA